MATATTTEEKLTAHQIATELYREKKAITLTHLISDFAFGGPESSGLESLTMLRRLWADGGFNEVNGHTGQPHDPDYFRVSRDDAIRLADKHGMPRRGSVRIVEDKIARRQELADIQARRDALLSNRVVQLLEDRRAEAMQQAKFEFHQAVARLTAGDDSQLAEVDRLADRLNYTPQGVARVVEFCERALDAEFGHDAGTLQSLANERPACFDENNPPRLLRS
ncbi:MAG: hypothetical protein ACYC6N_06560 [Pirellulaceae bacterium]